MPIRLRFSAFGLRGRIVGAVLITAVVTLLVAAVALLPRLESSLRNASKQTLEHDVANAHQEIAGLATLHYSYIAELAVKRGAKGPDHAAAAAQQGALRTALAQLSTRLDGADVTLIGYLDLSGHGGRLVLPATDPDQPDPVFPDVSRAFRTDQKGGLFGFESSNGQYVRAAIPLRRDDAVVSIYKAIDEVPAAATAVRRAFELAALIGLVLTALLAFPLAARLVRRLQRLRLAALRVGDEGTGVQFPPDRAHDEVGDLARSFAIMQRRLRQQEEARRAFVATASHELRTPLASLDGMLELLADDLREGGALDLADAQALLDRARTQSRRLGRLAADLLDLSRLDAEVRLRSEPVELCELSRAVVAEFELASLDRGVDVVLQETCGAVWALADPGSVARILRILLDNALRVAPRGSRVTVELGVEPTPWLSVRDEGPGVNPEERKLIFERFQRGRDTGGEAGFGLGLAIGRELAQRMHGSLVLVDSDEAGAIFAVTLAKAQAPAGDSVPATAHS